MSDLPSPTILEGAPQNDEISTTVSRCEYLLRKYCPIFMTRGKYLREDDGHKKRKQITDNQRLMAEVMFNRGLTPTQIAKHIGLTPFAVCTILYGKTEEEKHDRRNL